MINDGVLLALGFVEGFALILSPCILPILPILLAASLNGSKSRPFGIIIGFILVFSLFAYFSRDFVRYSGIDLNLIRYIAYGLLIALGVIMLSVNLTDRFSSWSQRLANFGTKQFSRVHHKKGFFAGFILGGLVAIVWTPCAGPILAAITVQTVIQKTTWLSFLTLLMFSLGAGIPMLVIALYGRQLMENFTYFKAHAVSIRKLLGAVIITSVIYMIFQEQVFINTATAESSNKVAVSLQKGLWRSYQSPAIVGVEAWINSPPLTIDALQGRVVLIDFWTYSCINCLRTLPYLKDWYQKYHDKGLVIIGVHSPEFDFEKNIDNVKNAVLRNNIPYPVVLDNQFMTWKNFSNHYWPAHYLINKQGRVVYEHFGEGEYDVTENNIRFLLGIDSVGVIKNQNDDLPSSVLTPETYLGFKRAVPHYSPSISESNGDFHFTNPLILNAWDLEGRWQVFADSIVSKQKKAALKIHFNARKVYMVMGSATHKPIKVKLLLNGEPLIEGKGEDIKQEFLIVSDHKLYEVLDLSHLRTGILTLISLDPGLEVYTFTFGK